MSKEEVPGEKTMLCPGRAISVAMRTASGTVLAERHGTRSEKSAVSFCNLADGDDRSDLGRDQRAEGRVVEALLLAAGDEHHGIVLRTEARLQRGGRVASALSIMSMTRSG